MFSFSFNEILTPFVRIDRVRTSAISDITSSASVEVPDNDGVKGSIFDDKQEWQTIASALTVREGKLTLKAHFYGWYDTF